MAQSTHAGGIVFRLFNDGPRYLVTTASKNPEHWIFPKGYIDSGETEELAAIREVHEETGVVAKIIQPIGTETFRFEGQEIYVAFFLMEFIAEEQSVEGRQTKWCLLNEAERLLTFANSRELLRRAHSIVADLMQASPL